MQLKDLIEKPISELTDSELEERLNILKRLKVMVDKPSKINKVSSNKDKRVTDLVSKLTPGDITKLMALLKGV